MRSSRLVIPTIVGALIAAACENSEETRERAYELEEIQAYGTMEEPDDTVNLPPEARRAGASILGGIVGVVQDVDSAVYVLDQQWKKIVAFEPSGRIRTVILGGAGEGPGEFMMPMHMAHGTDGNLAVLDYDLGRLSLFNPRTSEFVRSLRVDIGNPLRVAAVNDGFWITRSERAGSTRSTGVVLDATGRRIRELPALSEADRPFGASVQIAAALDGTVLIPSRRPGLWDAWKNGESRRIGVELFPDMSPPLVEQGDGYTSYGSAEATTVGIGVDHENRILLRYWTAELDDDGLFLVPETVRHFVAVFSETGERLGMVELEDAAGLDMNYFYVSPVTGHVFISDFEPYPRVREFRLVEKPEN